MPWLPNKPCAHPGCGRLVPSGDRHCDEHARQHRQQFDAKRRAEQPWRRWYNTARWRALRSWRLATEPLCRMCQGSGLVTAGTVVDHVEPHRGDETMFFDPENTQSLCKPCHDGAKQSQERRGRAG